jgi:hypothetical protein
MGQHVPLKNTSPQAHCARSQTPQEGLGGLAHARLSLRDVLAVEGEQGQAAGDTGGDAGAGNGTRTHRPRHDGHCALACTPQTDRTQSLFTFSSFMAEGTHSFVDVRFIAYNKNPDNNT